MTQLRIADEARADLRNLHRFGTELYGERSATTYVERLLEAIEEIGETPLLWALRDEVRPPVRLRRLTAHNIFYDLTETEVIVVRILHHAADWMHTL
jgi:toxin ParE1/3/4